MRITVKLFAILREKAGVSEALMELPAGATAAAAAREIGRRFPVIADAIGKAALAVNMEYVPADKPLSDGDELALIPPVSGGSDDDWLGITSEPIPVAKAIQFVTNPTAGGIAIFLGTTRTETDSSGRTLLALDYEAYEEMAIRQLRDLAQKSRQQWPITKLALLHRVGRVAAGEPSVLVAVSTPHRAEAFAACRWLIDSVKATATIWKKEIWSDGEGKWVDSSQTP
jgi:molybdopterin converting factor subunit 1